MFNEIIEKMTLLEEVQAIMLGGSRATGTYDEYSDYDVYVYLNKPLSEEKRRKLLDPYVSYMEYSNSFWELEDDGVLRSGVEIEFIYRDLEFIPSVLDNLFVNKNAGNGYSTCFYDNLIDSVLLFERGNYISNLLLQYKDAYTDEIAKVIIEKNIPLLKDSMPALYHQIEKATKRNDHLAINHRISEFFAIYFDIVFALNKEPHPGEKRMLEYAMNLDVKPLKLDVLINTVFENQYTDHKKMLQAVSTLIEELLKLYKPKQG